MRRSRAVLLAGRARSPKIARPTRTIVAPSAIAASRSSDMPIDSVSSAMPAAPSRSRSSRSARNCARCCSGSGVGSGIVIKPRSADPATPPPARASASTSAGATPLLLSSPLEVDLQADLQRRQRGGTGLAQTPRDLEPIDAVHPVEALGDEAGLVALDRSDEMPLDGQVLEALHLVERLLDIVLAECALPGRPGGAQGGRGKGLAHRDQAHCRRIAAGRPRRGLDAGQDCLQRLCDRGHNARRFRAQDLPAIVPAATAGPIGFRHALSASRRRKRPASSR